MTGFCFLTFYDWLSCYQEFPDALPLISNTVYSRHEVSDNGELITGEFLNQSPVKKEGSFCTSITIKAHGHRLSVTQGNPTRYNRLDNLFGFTSLDDCFAVYNQLFRSLGLPDMTKCKQLFYRQSKDGSKIQRYADGAVIQRVDITTNKSVGQGNVDCYLKALSTQTYRNSIPRLHSNGKTVDWLSKEGNANLIYPSVYNKAYELRLHLLKKIKAKYGENSNEYKHVLRVIEYCETQGVARFEQKLTHRQLNRMNAQYWGLFDERILTKLQEEFLTIDDKLQVDNMTFQGIAERLISSGICTNTKAANTSASYALQWMHGETFDTRKRQVQQHRARLRKIGIDISRPCDITTFSPIHVLKTNRVDVSSLAVPPWYQLPSVNKLTAVA